MDQLPRRLSTFNLSGCSHDWSPKTPKSKTFCEQCHSTIWVNSNACRCTVCMMCVHKKCVDMANKSSTCVSMLKKTSSNGLPTKKKFKSNVQNVQLPSLRDQISKQVEVTAYQTHAFIILVSQLSEEDTNDETFACFRGKQVYEKPVSKSESTPPPRPASKTPSSKLVTTGLVPTADDHHFATPTPVFHDEFDVLRVLSIFLGEEYSIREKLISIKILKCLFENPVNRRKFCVGALVPALIFCVKDDINLTIEKQFYVSYEALVALKMCFENDSELRKYLFSKKLVRHVLVYLGGLAIRTARPRLKSFDERPKLRGLEEIAAEKRKSSTLLQGAIFLWDLLQDSNHQYREYLEKRGALDPILQAVQHERNEKEALRVYKLIDGSEIEKLETGDIYDQNSCLISTGRYKGEIVAIKELNPNALSFASKFWRREVSLMTLVQDVLTIKFYGANPGGPGFLPFMVMEKAARGNLSDFITKSPELLTERLICHMCIQMINSVLVLHQKQIIHRDIKPQNFLVNSHCCIQLIDFGESRVLAKAALFTDDPEEEIGKRPKDWLDQQKMTQKTFAGTEEFMAPEVFFGQSYGLPADIYSLAVVFWTFFSRRMPFSNLNDIVFRDMLAKGTAKEKMPAGIHLSFEKIIEAGWEHDASKRMTLQQMLKILADMKDSGGKKLIENYKDLNDKTGLNFLWAAIKEHKDRLSLALTCKHFFAFRRAPLQRFKSLKTSADFLKTKSSPRGKRDKKTKESD